MRCNFFYSNSYCKLYFWFITWFIFLSDLFLLPLILSGKKVKMELECGHAQITKQQFNMKICNSNSLQDLFYFLMNTLLQVRYCSFNYCFCDTSRENIEGCQFCKIAADYFDFEGDLYYNMLHEHYMKDYQLKLYPYLSKLFYVRKEAICCFLNNE